jgi:hypothetical protein
VRYLYVPHGDTQRRAATSIIIFTLHVALWRDLSLRLLARGLLATLFVMPEIAARKALPPRWYMAGRQLLKHSAGLAE